MTIMANGENKQSFLRKPWVVGIVLSTLLMAGVALYSGFSYATNDDKFILQSFLGLQPGGPVHFSMYVRTLIAWPLFWLGTAFPGIAWFSILQLILIWLANAIISKSIIQCFDRYGKPLWCGVSAALLFLMLFTLYSTARITYTVTAAMLGAAAIAHLLSMDCAALTDRQYIAKALPSVLLLGLAYSLRSISLLPALGYCGIIVGVHALNGFGVGKYRKRSWRPIWISVFIGTAFLGCLFGARQLEINLNGHGEYVQWQEARTSVLDYLNIKELPRTACEQVGWSESKVDLLNLWYTMDESFSTQAFQTIARIGDTPQTRTSAGAAILDLQTRSPLIVRSLIVLFLLGICCTLWWLLFRGKEKRWPMIALSLTGALCMAMFCYLALQGRLPYRAVLVPVLPAAAIVFLSVACLASASHSPVQYQTRGYAAFPDGTGGSGPVGCGANHLHLAPRTVGMVLRHLCGYGSAGSIAS